MNDHSDEQFAINQAEVGQQIPEVSSSNWGSWKKNSVLLASVLVVAWYFWSGPPASSKNNRRMTQAANIPEGSESSGIGSSIAGSAAAEPEPPTDEEYRKLIVGTWETDRNGRREMIVKDDGTAIMDVTIQDTAGKFLLGDNIVLNLQWEIEGGVLTLLTTGGTPSGKVGILMSLYGKERKQKIITLDKTTLHHPDDEPEGKDHIWKRTDS